jgi:hypothetical protein
MVEGLQRRITALETSALAARVSRNVENLSDTVSNMAQDLNSRINGVDSRVGGIENGLFAIDRRLTDVENVFEPPQNDTAELVETDPGVSVGTVSVGTHRSEIVCNAPDCLICHPMRSTMRRAHNA